MTSLACVKGHTWHMPKHQCTLISMQPAYWQTESWCMSTCQESSNLITNDDPEWMTWCLDVPQPCWCVLHFRALTYSLHICVRMMAAPRDLRSVRNKCHVTARQNKAVGAEKILDLATPAAFSAMILTLTIIQYPSWVPACLVCKVAQSKGRYWGGMGSDVPLSTVVILFNQVYTKYTGKYVNNAAHVATNLPICLSFYLPFHLSVFNKQVSFSFSHPFPSILLLSLLPLWPWVRRAAVDLGFPPLWQGAR